MDCEKAKLYELLYVLMRTGLIINRNGNFKVNTKGDKIFLSDPSYYYIFNGGVGNFREAFVVFALKEIGKIYLIKNESDGDFIFEIYKIEVCCKNNR